MSAFVFLFNSFISFYFSLSYVQKRERYKLEKNNVKYAYLTFIIFFSLLLWKYVVTGKLIFLMLIAIVSVLSVSFMVDVQHQLLPDTLTLAATIFAVAINIYLTKDIETMLYNGGTFLLIFFIIYVVARGSFGFGDVKLSFLIGTILSINSLLEYIAYTLILAVGTSIILILLKKKTLKSKIAFGPFMIISFVIMLVLM